MKIRVYAWCNIYKRSDYFDIDFDFLPGIEISLHKHNFPPDEDLPIGEMGRDIFIIFSWLFWGITFNFNFIKKIPPTVSKIQDDILLC